MDTYCRVSLKLHKIQWDPGSPIAHRSVLPTLNYSFQIWLTLTNKICFPFQTSNLFLPVFAFLCLNWGSIPIFLKANRHCIFHFTSTGGKFAWAVVEGKERVNEECLDSDASHIGPAAPKEQVISGQVGHSDHIKSKDPPWFLFYRLIGAEIPSL